MTPPCGRLVAAVQANCNVSDARHARGMTLCTYLLEMRELFRWEQGAPLTATLPRDAVGAWLSGREALWEGLDGEDYRPLPLAGAEVDPFDADRANDALVPQGLVYGAGVGRFGKPQFFLAELGREERRDDARVLVAGREYARDLSPAPAASRAGTIYVRQDVLARTLSERAEAWRGRPRDGALASALEAYRFAANPEAALAAMAAAEAETLVLHELGERRAARLLSPDWERMLASFSRRRAEIFARAVRDHFADCTTTLPALLDRADVPSLHVWFSGLDGMRRELFPRLAAAYGAWRGGDAGALPAAVEAGAGHWRGVCARVLALYRDNGAAAEAGIEAMAADGGIPL